MAPALSSATSAARSSVGSNVPPTWGRTVLPISRSTAGPAVVRPSMVRLVPPCSVGFALEQHPGPWGANARHVDLCSMSSSWVWIAVEVVVVMLVVVRVGVIVLVI